MVVFGMANGMIELVETLDLEVVLSDKSPVFCLFPFVLFFCLSVPSFAKLFLGTF